MQRKSDRKRQGQRQEERQVLLDALERTRVLLTQAHGDFNAASDPDLTESYIYEIKALQARYGYLLRQIKELSGEELSGEELTQPMARPPETKKRDSSGGTLRQGPWRPISAYQ